MAEALTIGGFVNGWRRAFLMSAIALSIPAGATSANAKSSSLSYVIGAEVRYSNPQPIPRLHYQYEAQRRFSVELD